MLISKKNVTVVIVIMLLCGAVMVAYRPGIQGPFVFDDIGNIVDNPRVHIEKLDFRSLASATKHPQNLSQRRPLAYISFALNYYFGGMDPAVFRLTNVSILLLSIPLAAAASFLLARTWLPPNQSAFMALSATILWALNPLLTNAVTYIVQRMTSLNAFFCLVSLVCFLKGSQTTRRFWYIGSAVAWLLALSVKEIALPFVLVAFLYLWMTLPPDKRARRWIGWGLLASIVVSQIGIIVLFHANFASRNFDLVQRLLTEGRVVLRYMTLFLLPLPSRLNLDYEYALSQTLFTPPMTAVAVALHLLLISGALAVRRRRPLAAFCILSFYLLNLLESTVAPLEIIFEHRAYLPSFFLALGVTDLLTWVLRSVNVKYAKELVLALSVITGIGWGTMNYQRNLTWKDPVTLWEDIVAKAPTNDRARYNLGNAYRNTLRYQEAIKSYQEALRINPQYSSAYNNIGLIYFEWGLFADATTMFKRAINLEWQNPLIRFNLGLGYVRLGRKELAKEQLRILRMVDTELAEKLRLEIFP